MPIPSIKDNPRVGVAIFGGLVVLAILVGIFATRPSAETPTRLDRMYYSVDDGKTWFADDIDKTLPFTHDGKPASRAMIFKASGGQPYCGYLQRPTSAGLQKAAELRTKLGNRPGVDAQVAGLLRGESEVKRPGDAAWVPLQSREGSLVVGQPRGAELVTP